MALLDVRDALHTVAGRATDRVAPELWQRHRAAVLGLPDGDAAQVPRPPARPPDDPPVPARRGGGSDAVLAPARRAPARADPGWSRIAPGRCRCPARRWSSTGGADPAEDPLLLLRAAAEAAERDLVLAPATAARLVRESRPLPDPWPDEARDLFVRLLAAGPGLLGVWETLDETGALEQILPGVGAGAAAPARLRRPPVHRRPAPGRDLHRGVRADPSGGAPRRADGGRAAARHRQGPADRALRGG